jgi:hypothetical protein
MEAWGNAFSQFEHLLSFKPTIGLPYIFSIPPVHNNTSKNMSTQKEEIQQFDIEERRRKAEQASAAPMASAELRYCSDGSVDWGNMWDSY